MLKVILKGALIVIVVLVILMTVTALWFNWMISSEKGSKQEVLATTQEPAMKACIVYQPGMSDFPEEIAHQIARGLNESGYEVTLNYPGKKLSTDVSKYSVVVFGSPIYASLSCKPLTNYMPKIKTDPAAKIVLFTTGDTRTSVDLDLLEKNLKNITPYKKVKFYYDTKEESKKSAYELGKEIAK